MINSPESNVPQTEAEELVNIRLSNLEKEIDIAAKNLKVINKDTVKAIESRTYNEDLVVKANNQIKEKKEEVESLTKSVKQLTETSISIANENNERSLELAAKGQELTGREQATVALEKVNTTKESELDQKAKDILEDRKVTDTALVEFSKIKWR